MAIANITGNILTDSGVSTSSLVSGSGTTNYISKWTASGVLGNSLIFDNGTNVGIGNTNTTYTLDVTGTGRFTSALTIGGSVTSASQFIGSNTITDPVAATTTASVLALNGQSAGNNFGIGVGAIRNSAYDMWFQTGATNGGGYRWYIGTTERMTMTNTGNIGMGTTTPEQKLEVAGYIKMSGTSNAAYFGGIQASWAGSANYPTLYGASADRWVMHINPHISYVENGVNGYTGSSYGAMIRMASDTAANNYWDTGILYALGGDKWGIRRNNTTLASLTTGGTWSTPGGGTSDARTKQNIEYIKTNGIDAINLLKPAKFEFKLHPEKTRRGFIAQDVLEVIPDLVLGNGDEDGGTYGLDYDGILALAVKAIQELSAKVSALENKS